MKTRLDIIQDMAIKASWVNVTGNLEGTNEDIENIKGEIKRAKEDLSFYKEKYDERNSYTLHKLCVSLNEDITQDFLEILESDHPQDRLHEMCDSSIPVYNWDLTQYLANDFSLAHVEDEGLIEGVTDIFKIIQVSIYEALQESANDHFKELAEAKQENYEYLLTKYNEYLAVLEDRQASLDLDNDLVDMDAQINTRIEKVEAKIEFFEESISKIEGL